MRRQKLLLGVVLLALPAIIVPLAVARTSGNAMLHAFGVGFGSRSLAFDASTGHVFVISTDSASGDAPGVRMLNATTGALLRAVPMRAAALALTADPHAGHIWVTFFNDAGDPYTFASVLDVRSGTILRTISGNSQALPIALTRDDAGDLFALEASAVRMIDAGSGAPRRTFSVLLAEGARAIAADSRTHRIFAFDYCCENVLDEGKRSILYRASIGRSIDAAAVDEATGRVFVASLGAQDSYGNFSGSGAVTILDAGKGHPIWTTRVGRYPVALAVDERAGLVFVANRDSRSVSVLDARSGALLHTVAVDLPPVALAVDESAGHLLVLTSGGTVRASDGWGWLPGWLRHRVPFVPAPGPSTRYVPARLEIYDEARL